jgi:hypothetical protein
MSECRNRRWTLCKSAPLASILVAAVCRGRCGWRRSDGSADDGLSAPTLGRNVRCRHQ